MFILLKTKNNKKIISKLLFSPKKYCSFTYYTVSAWVFCAATTTTTKKEKKKEKKEKENAKRETWTCLPQSKRYLNSTFYSSLFISAAVPFSKFLSVSTLLASAATFFSILFWVPWTMATPLSSLSSLWLEARSTYLCSFFNSDWKLTTETWWQAQALWNMLWLLLWCSNGKVVCLDPFANSKYFQFYVGICV